MSKPLSRVVGPLLAAAALGAIAGGASALLSSSETLLRSSFAAALNPTAAPKPVRTAATNVPLAGSEEFWLAAMRNDGGTPVSRAVSIGDRIAMTLDGKERSLEVVSVSEFTPTKTEIDTRSGGVRLVLVTAHDTHDTALRPIRFVMELEGAPGTLPAPRNGRTL